MGGGEGRGGVTASLHSRGISFSQACSGGWGMGWRGSDHHDNNDTEEVKNNTMML